MKEKLRFFFFGYAQSDKERRYNCLMRIIWLLLLLRLVHVALGLLRCLIHRELIGVALIAPLIISGGLFAVVSTQLD